MNHGQDARATLDQPEFSKSIPRLGFSLVEVLASMAVLAVIVLMIGQLFSGSSRVWKGGTAQAEADGGVRGVLGFLTRRLSMAAADAQLPFYLTDSDSRSLSSYGFSNSSLAFVSLSQTATNAGATAYRSAEEFWLCVRNMQQTGGTDISTQFRIMVQNRQTAATIRCYAGLTPSAWAAGFTVGSSPLLDYVSKFKVWAMPPDGSGLVTRYDSANYGGQLPLWVDIFIEVLGTDDAIRATMLTGAALNEHIARTGRRYTQRVYFANRQGYSK